jgi:serine protease Do
MSLAAALVALLLAQEDPFREVLARLREHAGRSVVAVDADRPADPDADPDGRTGSGQVAQHRDYYNRPRGPATGLVVSADGHVLTTRFNVSGTILKGGLRVTLHDGRVLPATLLGRDEGRDLALLKIEATGLPVLKAADPAKLGQGTFVALLGRSPDRDSVTLNLGILGALNRVDGLCVQTDAEMNYGNAGGPLVTLRGEFVGLACHIRPDAVWGQSGGVGFACRAAEIDAVMGRLKAGETIAAMKKPFLGVRPGEGDPEQEGYQVAEVLPDSPAAKAGLKKDDVLVELDGRKVVDFDTMEDALQGRKVGDVVTIRLQRKGDGGWTPMELKAALEGRAGP